jgi:hypothetical protein
MSDARKETDWNQLDLTLRHLDKSASVELLSTKEGKDANCALRPVPCALVAGGNLGPRLL